MKIKDLRGVLNELSNVVIFKKTEVNVENPVYTSFIKGSFIFVSSDFDDWNIDAMFTDCNALNIMISTQTYKE